MIVTSDLVDAPTWEAATGWHLEAQGMCLGDRCIPVADITVNGREFPVAELARRSQRAFASDATFGVHAVGPEFNRPVLGDAQLPNLTFTDRNGSPVPLSNFRGRRIIVHAWAPW